MGEKRKGILLVLVSLMVLAVSGVAIYYWYENGHYVSTEDARITADMIKVSPKENGKILDLSMEEGDVVAKNQILGRIETESENPEKALIRAPISGIIIKKQANVGETYSVGQILGYIIDPKKQYIMANIEETKLGKLKEGQQVDVSIDEFKGLKFKGKLKSVGLATNSSFSLLPSSTGGVFTKVVQRVPVKIEFDDMGYKILPGTNAIVKINLK